MSLCSRLASFAFLLLCTVHARSIPLQTRNSTAALDQHQTHPLRMSSSGTQRKQGTVCNLCIQLSVQGINILLNEILNAGVVGGCSKLCSPLNGTENMVCNLVCDVVGIKAFVAAINHTDIDPLYFCELLNACPKGPDDAAASVTSVSATPTSGPSGTKFHLHFNFHVENATGLGEIVIAIDGPDGFSTAQSVVNTGYAPGDYEIKAELNTTDHPDSDPPVIWESGSYQYTFELCQGECHSKHPHSIFFGSLSSNFTITDSLNM